MSSINQKNSYNVKINTIDVTTIEVNEENKAYLVDKKFIDIIMSKLKSVGFQEFRDKLLEELKTADNMEQLQQKFYNDTYLAIVAEDIVKKSITTETE